ncbi:hypothetical protein V1477_007586 [Vespula maculifrons]|uniref:Uncharacterized protein n=1 Tax=Vespula maculifrons TaxID=7453 RepID=A0ABD2CG92_VESMC
MRKSVPKCGDAWGCNFSVWRLEFVGKSPLVRGSPDAATSTRWDLGRQYLLSIQILQAASISERMAAFFKAFLKFPLCNSKLNIEGRTFYILSYTFIFSNKFTIDYYGFSRVGPMGGAHGRGLLCGSPFSTEKSSLSFFSIHRHRSDVSSNGSVHNPSLGANTGKIERTFARVLAGTGVLFSGAIKSPTIMDFV